MGLYTISKNVAAQFVRLKEKPSEEQKEDLRRPCKFEQEQEPKAVETTKRCAKEIALPHTASITGTEPRLC